ncbi:MAG: alpha-galactosidase [Deltaproteobacteria bacterium]|nr:alpha-galactosidase [Deltaproteobacteria bacterium]
MKKAQPAVFTGIGTGPDDARALHADCQYDPAKRLEPGETLASELMVMNFQSASPFDALEHYADMLREWLGIVPWTERHPEIGVPAGWNSWSGGGSSGGYGTNIDEALMIENMDFADRELRRFGMNYFQLDDGWSTKNGDWVVNADRFPDHGDQNGIEWLLNRAADLGFLTGLWIRVFDAESSAQIVTDHPDWFTDPMLFGLIDVEGEQLDLSDPVVIDHIHDVIGMVKGWGIDWLKLDFGYLCPMTKGWLDPNLTRGEYYRRGVQAVRDALGDDIFFLNVAIKGWNYDLADSVRLTLDTQPVWDGEQPGNPLANQGLKPMYRDAARAYWLHKRVWVNHPDLMFFRAHKNTSLPPLTLEESRTFLTSVVLQGGLFKIGDRLVDLSGEAVDSLRRGLPVYGEPGRPLDLFRREYPEVWSLPVPGFRRALPRHRPSPLGLEPQSDHVPDEKNRRRRPRD